jgi:hypothetical protein
MQEDLEKERVSRNSKNGKKRVHSVEQLLTSESSRFAILESDVDTNFRDGGGDTERCLVLTSGEEGGRGCKIEEAALQDRKRRGKWWKSSRRRRRQQRRQSLTSLKREWAGKSGKKGRGSAKERE